MAQTAALAKILVAVDGSEASVEALRWARELAGPFNAQIEAVTCWEFPQLYDGYVTMRPDDFAESAAKVMEGAVRRVFGPETPRNLTTQVVQGNPKSTLTELSKGKDMLMVGRRGRSVVAGQLFGSVSAFCAAHAQCPVLVVHAPKPGPQE